MQYLIKLFLCLSIFINVNYIHSNEIFENNKLSVVLILGDNGYGTGVILSDDGYVLTNEHVVDDNPNLRAALNYDYDLNDYDEFIHTVEIIKINKQNDLALLKINNPKTLLRPIKISRQSPLVGDQVYAIGHPDFSVWSYTTGYISQIRDDFEWSYSDNFERLADVYETQTPIAEGSSGGPLLNKYGNLIGINTFGDEELSFQNFSLTVNEIIYFLNK